MGTLISMEDCIVIESDVFSEHKRSSLHLGVRRSENRDKPRLPRFLHSLCCCIRKNDSSGSQGIDCNCNDSSMMTCIQANAAMAARRHNMAVRMDSRALAVRVMATCWPNIPIPTSRRPSSAIRQACDIPQFSVLLPSVSSL